MQKIENFLKSKWYIFSVYTFALIIWTIKDPTQNVTTFGFINMLGIFIIVLLLAIILSLFKNTLYTIPLFTSLLFVVNNSQMSFDTLNQAGFPFIIVGLVILGPIVHIIRFKPKFKLKRLTLGLILIALAYMISYFNGPLNLKGLTISSVSLLYLVFYVFYSNTMKGNIDYLFKILITINLLLSFQLGIKIYEGIISHLDLSILENIKQGFSRSWYSNFGWANINDINFYIALTLPSYAYFIFKHPKNIMYWFMILIPTSVVILSGSRGGLISFLISVIGIAIIILTRGKQRHYIHTIIFVSIAIMVGYLSKDILIQLFQILKTTFNQGSIDSISSSRIYIYDQGLQLFKKSPVFGNSWLAVDEIGVSGRIFMFHSTIIQVLATMGLFGLFALCVHYYQIFYLLYDHFTFEKQLILIGYIATQLHGLIDNVQFSVPYSFLIPIIFAVIETSTKETSFKLNKGKYVYDFTLESIK